jgi:ribonuclease HII
LAHLTLETEQRAAREGGLAYVAGVDEAGRGALAGPVVAAAVILPLDRPDLLLALAEVDDSKKLNPARREALFDVILGQALTYGIGSVPAEEIDRQGIAAANHQAMLAAVSALDPAAQYLLVDGPLRLKGTKLPQQPVVRGDSCCLSIAAASIVAKVTRDRLMVAFARQYPEHGFESHKGYATAAHCQAIARYGPLPIHRHSFAPIRKGLF